MDKKPFKERQVVSGQEVTNKTCYRLTDVISITVRCDDVDMTFSVDMEVLGPNGPGYIEEISISVKQEASGIIAKAVGYLTILYRWERPGKLGSPFTTINQGTRHHISEFTPL